ncbi:hypothetical protein ACI2LM_13375 [Paenibacillus lautus]|uniref:hypothetical protein n=1 Tax=Paenibacillus lautus TaxID=1401 RepID=UPI00384A4E57
MSKYFKCELRLDNETELTVTEVKFLFLPRVGEHISTKIDGTTHQFEITDIWHWVGNEEDKHLIIIYVKHTGR